MPGLRSTRAYASSGLPAFRRTMPSSRVPAAAFPDITGAPPHTPEQALNNMAAHIADVSSLARDPSHDAAHERHVRDYLSANVPSHSNPSESPPWTLDDVIGVCSRFRLNTALGSDNVSPYFLRNGGPSLHRALSLLFSICWRYGVMPSSFRHGHVATLYKGEGEVNDPNSYRPISITSVVARVYERLQVQNMLNAMSRANMPSPSQFGFTRQRMMPFTGSCPISPRQSAMGRSRKTSHPQCLWTSRKHTIKSGLMVYYTNYTRWVLLEIYIICYGQVVWKKTAVQTVCSFFLRSQPKPVKKLQCVTVLQFFSAKRSFFCGYPKKAAVTQFF